MKANIDSRDEYMDARLIRCARVMWMHEKTAKGEYNPDAPIDRAYIDGEVLEFRRILLNWDAMQTGDVSYLDRVRIFALKNENVPRVLQMRSNPL